jgi:uncharacterized membrane protein YfcA
MNPRISSLNTLFLGTVVSISFFLFSHGIETNHVVSPDEEVLYPKTKDSSFLRTYNSEEVFENKLDNVSSGLHVDDSKSIFFRNRKLIERKEDSEKNEDGTKIKHKSLIPLSKADAIGYLCTALGSMLSAVGGVGGGGILIPIFILIMDFSPKYAIPLSSVTIFGGALANCIFNFFKRHPLGDRPLIDWDLILVMEPLTIAGALIGALINRLLPETFLVVMLVILLGYIGMKTLRKAHTLDTVKNRLIANRGDLNNETLEKANVSDNQGDDVDFEDEYLNNSSISGEKSFHSNGVGALRSMYEKELLFILEKERHVPKRNIIWLVLMSSVILMINMLKGGGDFKSPLGFKCGSFLFWIANLFMVFWLLLFSLGARFYLLRKHEVKVKIGYEYLQSDIQWNQRTTTIFPAICSVAGFFAGMFGIGGGIIKGPLMLAMGVNPQVASATSACMILFTSSSNIISYTIFGLLTQDYAIANLLIGFFFSMIVQIMILHLGRKYSKDSYIAYSIGCVVLLSAILMSAQSIFAIVEDEAGDNSLDKLCGTHY